VTSHPLLRPGFSFAGFPTIPMMVLRRRQSVPAMGRRIPKALRAACRLAILACVVGVLGGCYLPARFDAEVEITRGGYYDLIFDGYMVSVPLYEDLRKGKLSAKDEAKKVAALKADFTRDRAVTEFKYIRQGYFKVHWHKSGDLLKVKSVTFLRSNERIIWLRYFQDTGQITLEGMALASSNAKRLAEAGLNVQGELRVKTDATVISQNATRVVGDRTKTFIWTIKDIFAAPPKLVLAVH